MITFGIRAHDITTVSTPQALASQLKALNISSVQLAPQKSFPELCGARPLTFGLANSIRCVLSASDVDVAVLGSYFNMIDPNLGQREAGIKRFISNLCCAPALGTRIVASETGSVDPEFHFTEANFEEKPFQEALTTIRRLCDAAAHFGVMVGIEPGINHPIHDVASVSRMFEEIDSPNLGLILDPTALTLPDHADLELALTRDMLERFAPRICACHLVDFTIKQGELQRCAIGKGQAPIADMLELFSTYLPGTFVLSEFTQDEDLVSARRLIRPFEADGAAQQ